MSTNILIAFDASGSMALIKDKALSALNEFIQAQRSLDACLSLYFFNNTIIPIYTMVPISQIEPITRTAYPCFGFTALYDTVGQIIVESDNTRSILIIITDGEDNRSRSWTRESMNTLLNTKREEGWEVVFMTIGSTESQNLFDTPVVEFNVHADSTPEAITAISQGVTDYVAHGTMNTLHQASNVFN
jgi:hypothetical protein